MEGVVSMFEWLFGGSSKSKKKTADVGNSVGTHAVDQPEMHPIVKQDLDPYLFDGEERSIVYCYDGTLLSGTRKGDELYLDVLPYDVQMTSKATDTEIDSKERGVPVVAFDGKPIGTIQSTFCYFKELAFLGHPVRIKAERVGTYAPGIPEIEICTPPKGELRKWWDARSLLGTDIPFGEVAQVNLNERYVVSDIPQPIVTSGVTFELVHDPEHPKRKPWAVIYIDGCEFARINARCTIYPVLNDVINQEIAHAAIKQEKSHYDDGFFYQVTVVLK